MKVCNRATDVDCPRTLCFIYKAILASLYPVRCHISHLPRLGEKKLKSYLMNINEKTCTVTLKALGRYISGIRLLNLNTAFTEQVNAE